MYSSVATTLTLHIKMKDAAQVPSLASSLTHYTLFLVIAGGGALQWLVSKKMHLDGLLSAKGADGLNVNSGGGSGGSVLIETMNLTGHGEVNVNGGNGHGNQGGGGSGGRIGVHVNFQNKFGGL